MRGDIHNYKRRLESSLRNLENSKILKKNKEHIIKFKDQCFLERLSISRVDRYIQIMRQLAEILKKDFEKADKNDIIRVVQEIESRDYTEWTKQFYRVGLKKFYKWLRKSKDFPVEVEWLKLSMKNNGHKLPEELLTEEEVKRMIENADHSRDKAFIATLYESGCRVSEIGTLSIKHVSFDKHGAFLMVDGKTGMRRVRVINAVPYLSMWMESHPFRENPNAPLWVLLNKRKCELIKYGTIGMLLKRIGHKAGIKKKVNPHSFRHARATHLATHLTEAQMKQYFGWVQSSDMAATYVHLSGRDVDSALLKINGIEVEEAGSQVSRTLKPLTCVRCKFNNPATGKFCGSCGAVLDIKTAVEMDEKRENSDELMNELVKDSKIMELLKQKIAVIRGGQNGC